MWGLKLVEDIGHIGAAEGPEQLEWVRRGLNGQGDPHNIKARLSLEGLSGWRRLTELAEGQWALLPNRSSRFYTIVNMAFEMHSNACQCIARPNTALLDCILCMIQAFYQALQIGVSLGTCI